jgi:hypothetical protein
MLISLMINFQANGENEPAPIAIADSAFRMSLTP